MNARFAVLTCAALMAGAPAQAATIAVTVDNDNTTCFNNIDGLCNNNGSGTFDDYGSNWSANGGVSSSLTGSGSTSTGLSIDAVTASDDGGVDVGQSGDRQTFLNMNFDLILAIDVDNAGDSWTVDLNQNVLGLFGLNGDGTLSAVGTQNNGSGSISAITTNVNGSFFNFGATPSSYSNNPSNNSSASQQFSGNRADAGVLVGTGDAIVSVNIDIDLSALSQDGCSGFVCSSASGGEEAAVLFGLENAIDQDVDDYSYWGRNSANDGYDSIWTLNVTVPEPSTIALLGLGLVGLARLGRRD